jgi:hypothetical protein
VSPSDVSGESWPTLPDWWEDPESPWVYVVVFLIPILLMAMVEFLSGP